MLSRSVFTPCLVYLTSPVQFIVGFVELFRRVERWHVTISKATVRKGCQLEIKDSLFSSFLRLSVNKMKNSPFSGF